MIIAHNVIFTDRLEVATLTYFNFSEDQYCDVYGDILTIKKKKKGSVYQFHFCEYIILSRGAIRILFSGNKTEIAHNKNKGLILTNLSRSK